MKDHSLIKIQSTGGLFTTQDVRSIVKTAIYYGVKYFFAGARQELLFYIEEDKKSGIIKKLEEIDVKVIYDTEQENIISSLCSVNVFPKKSWLKSGTYLDIIHSFKISPKLTVGIIDPNQELIPLCLSQLNFIASDDPDYWYLYLCLKRESKPYLWPVKVDTSSIYTLAKQIGGMVLGDKIYNEDELVSLINQNINYSYLTFKEQPELPSHVMPRYDGFHTMKNDRYWLGVTQQRNMFSTAFLEGMAYQCQKQNINNIYLTTWGSIVIRHVERKSLPDWNKLLSDFSINTGHAYSELNWLIGDVDHDDRKIKRKVVSYFFKKNPRTEGLVFGVETESQDVFPNVLIKQIPIFPLIGWYKYDVSYAQDFNANTRVYHPYRQRVAMTELPEILYSLCKEYSKFLLKGRMSKKEKANETEEVVSDFVQEVHQCQECFSVYDPQYGDQEAGVLPGTQFEDIEKYKCPVCGADKSSFSKVKLPV